MRKDKNDSNWISMSDMMTGLMLVFLFLSILNINQVQNKVKIIEEFDQKRQEIFDELNTAFKTKYEEWQMVIEQDLTVKFNDPDMLFSYMSSELTPKYKQILNEFIPIYIGIINKDKYNDSIKEIKIEGHTAQWDDYNYTINLSQDRANAVLFYMQSNSYYYNLTQEERDKLKFWFTSNGLGNGRSLDINNEYTYFSKKPIDKKSRRVEFRIVTTSEELVEKVLEINK